MYYKFSALSQNYGIIDSDITTVLINNHKVKYFFEMLKSDYFFKQSKFYLMEHRLHLFGLVHRKQNSDTIMLESIILRWSSLLKSQKA